VWSPQIDRKQVLQARRHAVWPLKWRASQGAARGLEDTRLIALSGLTCGLVKGFMSVFLLSQKH